MSRIKNLETVYKKFDPVYPFVIHSLINTTINSISTKRQLVSWRFASRSLPYLFLVWDFLAWHRSQQNAGQKNLGFEKCWERRSPTS